MLYRGAKTSKSWRTKLEVGGNEIRLDWNIYTPVGFYNVPTGCLNNLLTPFITLSDGGRGEGGIGIKNLNFDQIFTIWKTLYF